MKRLILLVVALNVVALTSIATAQSLGDVARREEQRRKAIKKPAKVYTNKDLAGSDIAPPTSAPSSGAFSSGQSASESAPPAGGDSSQSATSEGAPSEDATAQAGAQTSDDAPATKDDWQKRLQDARSSLERSQMFAEALQTRINSLTTDFVARDDPAQRSAIEGERRKALAQLDKVKREIEDQNKAIADIQEQARRAGVPAGWVR